MDMRTFLQEVARETGVSANDVADRLNEYPYIPMELIFGVGLSRKNVQEAAAIVRRQANGGTEDLFLN